MSVGMRPAVELRHVSKSFRLPHQQFTTFKEHFKHPLTRATYERQQALDDVSFEIEESEFLGIIGANGSGKSTLLKVLAGIYRADSGSVDVRGRMSPFIELGVGFNPELNARDNILVNGTLLGMTRREIADKLDEIVAFAELERFVDQKLKNYSSGMQLRLAYSIAIQVPFDILLLDEVLAVGDERFQEKCFATFEQMKRERKTIVLVSHDLETVRRFADRVLLLRNTRVAAIGAPDDVIAEYRRRADVAVVA